MRLIDWAEKLPQTAILLLMEGGQKLLKHPYKSLVVSVVESDDWDSPDTVVLSNEKGETVATEVYPNSYGGQFIHRSWRDAKKVQNTVVVYE